MERKRNREIARKVEDEEGKNGGRIDVGKKKKKKRLTGKAREEE